MSHQAQAEPNWRPSFQGSPDGQAAGCVTCPLMYQPAIAVSVFSKCVNACAVIGLCAWLVAPSDAKETSEGKLARHAVSIAPPSLSPLGPVPVKGITIGPIESALHPDRGYGTAAYESTLSSVRSLGANWIALTVFGRIASLESTAISLSFEQPFPINRAAVLRAVHQAHRAGLKVFLVPHLWVESGEWRGELAPKNGAWDAWAAAYEKFVLEWARVAQEGDVDLFSAGVELRSWVTSSHAAGFIDVIDSVRKIYRGPITYAANWDDVEETAVLAHLDVIGVNAFFPLSERPGTRLPDLLQAGSDVASRMRELHQRYDKPILFTEIGYTNRTDPALRPWEWPDSMSGVQTAPRQQAEAFAGLLAPLLDEPWFSGFFVWRIYSDLFDSSQEAEWGFSPLYREAELVLRDAFMTRWRVGYPDLATRPPRLAPTPFRQVRATGLAKF